MKDRWKRNWVWMTALAIGLAGAFIAAAMGKTKELEIQQGIAHEIIRFHVLANSNSDADQKLKMDVKEKVIGYMQTAMEDVTSVDESRAFIASHLDEIKATAAAEVTRQGYSYAVTSALATAYFPVKTYGDCTFPAGDYEALQIKIGKAAGKNWWCVVYPSLCFTDTIQGVVDEAEKEELKGLLTEEEYDSILQGGHVKVRFKWLPR